MTTDATVTGSLTQRRDLRRRQIVDAAADLFARSGFAAVGMDQIGAATGITGPAIYRHFQSKSAVLVAVFDGILDAVTDFPAPPQNAGPTEQLAALVHAYARAVAERRRLMTVFVREVHHLPAQERIGLDERQRQLVRRWRGLLAQVHPDWSSETVRTAVHGAFGLCNAVATFDSPLSDSDLAVTLEELTSAALELRARDTA